MSNATESDNYIFSGYFDKEKFELELTPIVLANPNAKPTPPTAPEEISDYKVVFKNAANNIIYEYYISKDSTIEDNESAFFYFIAAIPKRIIEDADKISFMYNDSEIGSVLLSGESPVIEDFNIKLDEGIVNISWDVSDEDSEKLFLSLYYQDNDSAWFPLLFEVGIENPSSDNLMIPFNVSGEEIKFELIISDGFHETENLMVVSRLEEKYCNGADINKDGKVDVADLSILGANYGRNCSSEEWCSGADINQNGKVDVADLSILVSNYGKNCSISQ